MKNLEYLSPILYTKREQNVAQIEKTETDFIKMQDLFIEKVFIQVSKRVFLHTIDFPIGNNYASFLAYLFVTHFKAANFLRVLQTEDRKKVKTNVEIKDTVDTRKSAFIFISN